MNRPAESKFGLIFSGLVLAAIAGASFPLLATGGLVHNAISLDFHHIAPWIAVGAALLLFSRVAAIASAMIEARLLKSSGPEDQEEEEWDDEEDQDGTDEEESESTQVEVVSSPLLRATLIAQGALQGLGWATLVSGALALLATLPATISARPGAADVESLERYLGIFGSLIKWIFAAGIFYGLLRTARVLWPAAHDALPFPMRPVVYMAVAYVLLAGGGVFDTAFNFPGGLVLIILALALALPYLASVLRSVVTLSLPTRVLNPARILLLVIDIGWIALILGIMLSLPRIVGDIPELQPGGALASVAPYLDIFDTLAFWSIILLTPFILVRAIAAFRPAVGEVFGFPMGRILLFALALVGLSDNGIPATASSFPIPQLMPAMAAALVISYLTLILRRVAQLGLPPRVAIPMTNIPPLVGALMPAISVSLVVWALLQSSPLISAPLLDNSGTSGFGEASLPYFAGLFEVRFALIGFVFLTLVTWALPDPLWTPAQLRVRPLLAALGFTAAGCFLWLAMAPLSGVGHVFPLLGAIVGAGLLTLGLSQLAGYYVDSPEPLYSGPARWFTNSKVRGFIVGAALVFYGMLLRPLVYETLWFAAVYEWIVVFAVAVWAMFKIRGGLKSFVETAEAAPMSWTRWNRHEQQFEDRPDPRRILVSRWERQFVESGHWASLWAYQMGLLCRHNATPQDVQRVFRPLRDSVVTHGGGGLFRRRGDRDRRRRGDGLAASFHSTEQILSSSPALPTNVDASAIEHTSSSFISTGTDSEAMASTLISAYRGRGADTHSVVALWFPIVNVVDIPPRWFHPPWVRNRTRRRSQERRKRLVEGAISHLSGETTVASLTVGVAARRAPLSPATLNPGRPASTPVTQPGPSQEGGQAVPSPASGAPSPEQGGTASRQLQHRMALASSQTPTQRVSAQPGPAMLDAITPGQGFEIISEANSSYMVRTSENVVGYVSKTALEWLPILPGDEVISD